MTSAAGNEGVRKFKCERPCILSKTSGLPSQTAAFSGAGNLFSPHGRPVDERPDEKRRTDADHA